MAQHIAEQHCYTTPAQPLKASYLVRIQVLEITSLHLFVNRHLQHSFSILSSSANTIQTFSWSFTVSERLSKKLSKKIIQWLFERDSVILKTAPGPRFYSALSFNTFFLCFLFFFKYKSNGKVSCYTSAPIPSIETPSDWLVIDIFFMLDLPLYFTICLAMLWQ